MATYSATYDFASSLSPSAVDAELSASALTKGASATSLVASGGVASGQSGIITSTSFPSGYIARQYYIDLEPTTPGTPWTPGSLMVKAKITATGGAIAVRSDADSYATNLLAGTTLTTTLTEYGPVDLSGIGEITGPLRLAIWLYSNSTTSRTYNLDDIVVTADFTAAAGQSLAPGGIASTAALGSPTLAQAVALVLSLVGIASTSQIGSIEVGLADPLLWVPLPTTSTVLAFLKWPIGYAEQVASHLGVITELAKAYTRSNGFDGPVVRAGLAAVIVAATARLVANPEQHSRRVGNLRQAPSFQGWTLAERTVLNEYRGVAR